MAGTTLAAVAARPAMTMRTLKNDTRVADALIAFDEVDLLGGDLPAAVGLREAVTRPAAQETRLVAPEFVDQEIGPHHAHVIAVGGEHLHVGDQPHGARRRRLRPGKARAQTKHAVLEP